MLMGLMRILVSGFAGTSLVIHNNLRRKDKKRKTRFVTGIFTWASGIFAVYISLKSAGVFLLSLTSFLVSVVVMCCMCMAGDVSENERLKSDQED